MSRYLDTRVVFSTALSAGFALCWSNLVEAQPSEDFYGGNLWSVSPEILGSLNGAQRVLGEDYFSLSIQRSSPLADEEFRRRVEKEYSKALSGTTSESKSMTLIFRTFNTDSPGRVSSDVGFPGYGSVKGSER